MLINLRNSRDITSHQAWSNVKGHLVQWLIIDKLEKEQPAAICDVTQNLEIVKGTIVSLTNPLSDTVHTELDIVQQWAADDGRTIEAKSNTGTPLKTNMRRELYGELNLGKKAHGVMNWIMRPCLAGLADEDDVLNMLDNMDRYCKKQAGNVPFNKDKFGAIGWLS